MTDLVDIFNFNANQLFLIEIELIEGVYCQNACVFYGVSVTIIMFVFARID